MQETLWYLLAGGVVLCLPGLAWWAWFPEKEKDILECIAEVSGLSIAITALVTLGFFLFDVRLSPASVGIIYSLLGVLAAAGFIYKRVNSKNTDEVGQSPGEDLGPANSPWSEQTQPGGEQAAQILEQDYPTRDWTAREHQHRNRHAGIRQGVDLSQCAAADRVRFAAGVALLPDARPCAASMGGLTAPHVNRKPDPGERWFA